MIVLQIEITDVAAAFDVESQPPIAADRNAPCPGAVALEPMNAPAGRPDNLGHVVGDDQRGEDVAQPLRKVRPKLPAVVVLDEAQKPSMLNAPDPHASNVRRDRTDVKASRRPQGGAGRPFERRRPGRPGRCSAHIGG